MTISHPCVTSGRSGFRGLCLCHVDSGTGSERHLREGLATAALGGVVPPLRRQEGPAGRQAEIWARFAPGARGWRPAHAVTCVHCGGREPRGLDPLSVEPWAGPRGGRRGNFLPLFWGDIVPSPGGVRTPASVPGRVGSRGPRVCEAVTLPRVTWWDQGSWPRLLCISCSALSPPTACPVCPGSASRGWKIPTLDERQAGLEGPHGGIGHRPAQAPSWSLSDSPEPACLRSHCSGQLGAFRCRRRARAPGVITGLIRPEPGVNRWERCPQGLPDSDI